VLGAALYVFLVSRRIVGPEAPRRSREPTTVAAAAGLLVLAVVGLVVNDSSIAVPVAMMAVLAPVIVVRGPGSAPTEGKAA
jgi:hypothetical protein